MHLLSHANNLLMRQNMPYFGAHRLETGRSKRQGGHSAQHRHELTASAGHQWVIAAMQPQSISHFSPSHFFHSDSAFLFVFFFFSCSPPATTGTAASSFHSNRAHNHWRTLSYPLAGALALLTGDPCAVGAVDLQPAADVNQLRGDTEHACKLIVILIRRTHRRFSSCL